MKRASLTLFFFGIFCICKAQKEMLTKTETIAYIDKKCKEVEGMLWTDNSTLLYSSVTFKVTPKGVEYSYFLTDDKNSELDGFSFSFNPMYITELKYYAYKSKISFFAALIAFGPH